MWERDLPDYQSLYRWSVVERSAFWEEVVDRLEIQFRHPYSKMLDVLEGPANAKWLVDARLNLIESCFQAPADDVAIVSTRAGSIERVTYGELQALMSRVANGLVGLGIGPGDRVAIVMPMTVEAVAAYCGVVAAGAAVVGIADSFAAPEIASRLAITRPALVITQDHVIRDRKRHPLYEKLAEAEAPPCVVVEAIAASRLRDTDRPWEALLAAETDFSPVELEANAPLNILFSSGTVGEPKAIPWSHTTPIKSAMDAHFHHDLHPDDVVCWPTNLGWMMGPWLIFGGFINRTAIALYPDTPTTREFGEFVRDAQVSMLGVVPSLVRSWKATDCLHGVDWSGIRRFSSTGETSNPEEMAWLMNQAGGKPIIEYCGGTEIGGGYITATLLQPALPSTFTTPALGIDFRILDDRGQLASRGEVFLVPPSIGLSTELLNADHAAVYYADAPAGPAGEVLRRHGDEMETLADGYYRALGRADDTMNLGGIKVSSAEIERVLQGIVGVAEVAAIGVPPVGGGSDRLVVFTVAEGSPTDLLPLMQEALATRINPLFRIHSVQVIEALPRTASNKTMRRTLRNDFVAAEASNLTPEQARRR